MVISQIFGWVLLTVTISSIILLYRYVFKSKMYDKDIFGLIADSLYIVEIAFILILFSLILIKNK